MLMKVSMAFMMMAILFSCNDDETGDNPPSGSPVIVQFEDDATISENAGLTKVTLTFNKPAPKDGTVIIEVTTDSPNDFQTEPAIEDDLIKFTVSEGDEGIDLAITPINNQVLDGNKEIELKLIEVSEGYTLGDKKSATITITDDEAAVSASFASDSSGVLENNDAGEVVLIELSASASAEGKIIVQLTEVPAGLVLNTEPALDFNNKLELTVPLGATEVSFIVVPNNDELLKGHKTVKFNIVDTEGGVEKGATLSFEISIQDDELVGKPRSYESVGGGWRFKETYEYDEQGRVAEVYWEKATPVLSTGTNTYTYANNGLIESIKRSNTPDIDELFHQENGRIVKSEEIANGVVSQYTLYDYDDAGNVSGSAIHYRQQSGEYKLGLIFVYLYFTNGNIYKQLGYAPVENSEDPEQVSSRTYDHYMDVNNPFPMISVIPNVVMQHQLPALFILEEGGGEYSYDISYEFLDNGLPSARTISGTGGTEITNYTYY